jgi:hypothetical protein
MHSMEDVVEAWVCGYLCGKADKTCNTHNSMAAGGGGVAAGPSMGMEGGVGGAMEAMGPGAGEMGGDEVPRRSSRESTLEDYEVLGLLGKGSFGTVSKIRRKADGRVRAWAAGRRERAFAGRGWGMGRGRGCEAGGCE